MRLHLHEMTKGLQPGDHRGARFHAVQALEAGGNATGRILPLSHLARW